MDGLSEELILDLLRQDLTGMQEQQKGKQLAGNLSDVEIALQIFEEGLDQSETAMQDRRLAFSINDALQGDEDALMTAAQEEDQALDDRQLALELAGRTQTPQCEYTSPTKGEFMPPSTGDSEKGIGEGSSRSPRQGESTPGDRRFECAVCWETKFGFDTIQLPCAHRYCVECIIAMFEDSLSNECSFPPKCCREAIVLSSVQAILGVPLVRRFEEKERELRDPNRTYCADRDCSIYISPELVEEYVGTCRFCQERTCVRCKKVAHPGTCSKDLETKELLDKAKAERWQRCYKCYTMVELKSGCYHIT